MRRDFKLHYLIVKDTFFFLEFKVILLCKNFHGQSDPQGEQELNSLHSEPISFELLNDYHNK